MKYFFKEEMKFFDSLRSEEKFIVIIGLIAIFILTKEIMFVLF